MARLVRLVPAAAALAVVGGCGGSGGGGAQQGNLGENPGVKGTAVTIVEKDYTLTPETISLPKPGTYTFQGVDEGAQAHSLAVEGNGVHAKGKNIAFGEKMTFEVTFKKPGKYAVYCPVDSHRSFGMEGTVTVGSG